MATLPLPQLFWGSTLENRLDFPYPLESPVTYPLPREGSDTVEAADGSTEDGAYVGTDYALEADLRYVPDADIAAILASGSSPPNGVDALLTWARQRGLVRLVPDRAAPLNYVDGYLIEPWSGPPAVEPLDGSQRYHVKFRTGQRSYGESLRGLLFEYLPGMSVSAPRALTNSRSSSAVYWDATGVVRTVAAGVIRDDHYPLGLGSTVRVTLLEVASVNSCLQSQALATTPWGTGQSTATNNVASAPDLTTTASGLVPNTTSSALHNIVQNITITSAEFSAVSVFIKANGYTGFQLFNLDPSGANGYGVWGDLTAGTITTFGVIGAGVLTGSVIVPLANGWFWVGIWGAVNGGITSTQFQVRVYDTGAHAQTSTAYAGDGTKGLLLWGAQLERWGTTIKGTPTSYMATTTGTASRSSDLVTTPWSYQTQPVWCYQKHIDVGLAQRNIAGTSAFDNALILADSAANYPRQRIMWGNGGPQTISEVRASPSYLSDSLVAAPGIVYGAVVETFSRWFADNHVETQCSVNGGAVVTGSDSGGLSEFFDFSLPTLLQLRGQHGLQVVKLGTNPTAVTTLAQAALV